MTTKHEDWSLDAQNLWNIRWVWWPPVILMLRRQRQKTLGTSWLDRLADQDLDETEIASMKMESWRDSTSALG